MVTWLTKGGTWLYDNFGNRANIEKWGSVKQAEKALKTLKNCKFCTDCINCSDCDDCIGCKECLKCSECYECVECISCIECVSSVQCRECVCCCLCISCLSCSFCYYSDDCYTRSNDYADQFAEAVPVVNNIHSKVYEVASKTSALNMSEWHSCKTVHCRAGWVVTLAGNAGALLESKISTLFAAYLIYKKSDPVNKVSILRFYDSNESAISDMKRLATVEATG